MSINLNTILDYYLINSDFDNIEVKYLDYNDDKNKELNNAVKYYDLDKQEYLRKETMLKDMELKRDIFFGELLDNADVILEQNYGSDYFYVKFRLKYTFLYDMFNVFFDDYNVYFMYKFEKKNEQFKLSIFYSKNYGNFINL